MVHLFKYVVTLKEVDESIAEMGFHNYWSARVPVSRTISFDCKRVFCFTHDHESRHNLNDFIINYTKITLRKNGFLGLTCKELTFEVPSIVAKNTVKCFSKPFPINQSGIEITTIFSFKGRMTVTLSWNLIGSFSIECVQVSLILEADQGKQIKIEYINFSSVLAKIPKQMRKAKQF